MTHMSALTPKIYVFAQGRKEVVGLGVVLVGLLVAAYVSWNRSDTKGLEDRIPLVDVRASDIQSVSMVTRTQTVSIERRKSDDGESYLVFSTASPKPRSFVANKEAKDHLEQFGPLLALRGLGSSFSPEALREMKLSPPEGKLVVREKKKDHTFSIGGRTYSSRDYYVRRAERDDVYLLASRTLSELEYPEGRFMQRKLRTMEDKDVASITVKAGPKEKRLLHQNRLSDDGDYWVDANTPETKDETIANYVSKIDSLTATNYLDADAMKGGVPVLSVTWHEDTAPKETMSMVRIKEGENEKYVVLSTTTKMPVEVPKSTAEQLEQELATLMAN